MSTFYLEYSGVRPMFDFIYASENMTTVSISYYDVSFTRSVDWWTFIDKVKRGVPASISCGSRDDISGDVRIDCVGRDVSFVVDRGIHSGVLGRANLNVPKELALDALIEAATALEAWEKKQTAEKHEQ